MRKYDFQDVLYHFYGVFVGGVTFWIYVKTLAPTVSFFDSGELISAAYTLGVAHPPGYPLYVLLGWLFSKLPIGAGAYRLNLMSACFGALAAYMLYHLAYTLLTLRPRLPAVAGERGNVPARPEPERMLTPVLAMIAALTFAFAKTPWQQALIAEVYALNTFFCGLIMLLLVRWHRVNRAPHTPLPQSVVTCHCEALRSNPPSRSLPASGEGQGWGASSKTPRNDTTHSGLLYLTAFLFGLGFGNHQTISLLFCGGAVLVIWTTPRILRQIKTLALIVIFLVLGLSIYLLIPLRAAHNPPINWGNAVTFRQFQWLVLREGYKDVAHGQAVQTLWRNLTGKGQASPPAAPNPPALPAAPEKKGIYPTLRDSLFLKQLASFNPVGEFGYFGLMLALVGFSYGLFCSRPVSAAMLLALLFLAVVPVLIGDPPEENIFLNEEFQVPSYLLVAAWIGLGMAAIARGVFWVAAPSRNLQYAAVFILAVFFLAVPGVQMRTNLKTVDRRQNYVEFDYAANILDSLKPNAILFTWGDSGAFPLWYMQIVEHRRPDVTLIHVPHLSAPWYVALLPPELFISPEPFQKYAGDMFPLIDEIVQKHWLSRPMYFDYSSAHSLTLPYELLPHGIVYKVATPGDTLDETVWQRYRLRGILDNTRIALDPDIKRAFLMYGSARIELGNYYLDRNELEKAANEFNEAVKFDPSLGDHIVRMLQFQDKMGGEKPAAP